MNTTIIKLIPYTIVLLVGVYLSYSFNTTTIRELKNENLQLQVKLESSESSLVQERKFQKERELFNKELQLRFDNIHKQLNTYNTQLRVIKDARIKDGVNDSLSDDVTRVLQDFQSNTNKD